MAIVFIPYAVVEAYTLLPLGDKGPGIRDLTMADLPSDFIRLNNVDSSFQNRSNSIFDRLNSLEPAHGNTPVSKEDEIMRNRHRNVNKNGNQSGRLPARVPQHVLSPDKWTKYSLENDGSEPFRGLNEHNLNKYAAHTFLADLQKRKSFETKKSSPNEGKKSRDVEGHVDIPGDRKTPEQSSNQNIELASNDAKLLFKKPESKVDVTSHSTSVGVWKDGTYVMPEHVVGVTQPKVSPRSGERSTAKTVVGNGPVNLDHLEDNCGEDILEKQVGKMNTQKGRRNFRKRKIEEDKNEEDCEKSKD